METNQTATEQPVTESSLEDRFADALFGSEETEEVQEQEAVESETDEQSGNDTVEGAPELVDVDFEGEQFKLPPKVKDALMRQSDYTRKTQAYAEKQRELDAKVYAQQTRAEFEQSVAQEVSTLQQIDTQLNAYKQLDWASMDTETITRTKLYVDQLRDQKAELERGIHGKHAEFQQKKQAADQHRVQAMNNYLKQHIPQWEWGGKLHQDIGSYAVNAGVTPARLATADAADIELAWKAKQWDDLQSQKATSTKRAETAPPIKRPGGTQNAQAQSNAAYQESLRKAKTPGQRERVISDKFATKLFGT
jgi:hypothetical protein